MKALAWPTIKMRGKGEAAETIADQSTRLAELESIKTSAEATTAANFDARLKARDEEIAELKKKNKALSRMHASFLGNSTQRVHEVCRQCGSSCPATGRHIGKFGSNAGE